MTALTAEQAVWAAAMQACPDDANLLQLCHDEWIAGRLTTDDVRRHFMWLWDGLGDYSVVTPALAMLDAIGYVTDSPDVRLPDLFPVYRGHSARPRSGRLEVYGLGLSWTMNPDLARSYATRYAVEAGDEAMPVVIGGRVRRQDVLMFCRLSNEVLARPGQMLGIHVYSGSDAAPAWASSRDEADADRLARSIYMPKIRLIASPGDEEAEYRSLRDRQPIFGGPAVGVVSLMDWQQR